MRALQDQDTGGQSKGPGSGESVCREGDKLGTFCSPAHAFNTEDWAGREFISSPLLKRLRNILRETDLLQNFTEHVLLESELQTQYLHAAL